MLTKMRRHGDSIALTKRACLSLCGGFVAPGLPSPSLLRNATSPKGRGFGRPGSSELTAESIYAAKYSALLSKKAASEQ